VSSSNKSAKDTQAAAYIYLQLVILNVCVCPKHTLVGICTLYHSPISSSIHQ